MELLTPSIGLLFWSLLWLALWLIALIDILRSDFGSKNHKLAWVLIIFLIPMLGAILYFMIGRKNKVKLN